MHSSLPRTLKRLILLKHPLKVQNLNIPTVLLGVHECLQHHSLGRAPLIQCFSFYRLLKLPYTQHTVVGQAGIAALAVSVQKEGKEEAQKSHWSRHKGAFALWQF